MQSPNEHGQTMIYKTLTETLDNKQSINQSNIWLSLRTHLHFYIGVCCAPL